MRTCVICNADMQEGFLNEDNGHTYCKIQCLNTHMTTEEYHEAYDEGTCFWTNWEDDDVVTTAEQFNLENINGCEFAENTFVKAKMLISNEYDECGCGTGKIQYVFPDGSGDSLDFNVAQGKVNSGEWVIYR